jgi:hypothetical protein
MVHDSTPWHVYSMLSTMGQVPFTKACVYTGSLCDRSSSQTRVRRSLGVWTVLSVESPLRSDLIAIRLTVAGTGCARRLNGHCVTFQMGYFGGLPERSAELLEFVGNVLWMNA